MANRLHLEKSPYLQQHKDNPVDWYPWGEEAFKQAKRESKPILLSIGYAACHWCHVMAHESFEDEETAQLMNALFINIKVDKEERPDLDKIYQTAHYYLTRQQGGWPLTLFLMPTGEPFFSGTYFPKEDKFQLPGFKRLLKLVSAAFKEQGDKLKAGGQQLHTLLNQEPPPIENAHLTLEPWQRAQNELEKTADSINGGFGGAPKFPEASKLFFLMQNQADFLRKTLKQMAEGGIYDQLEGGFFRYAVDAAWGIPHFEKMLYDNAQLLSLYALGSQIYPHAPFADIALETADWLIKHMKDPEGGFYASLDADSLGEEGKFYYWDKAEIKALLPPQTFELVSLFWGLNKAPNFEGHWHLYQEKPFESLPKQLNYSLAEAKTLLHEAKDSLIKAREQRPKPFRDEKRLTAWNALVVKALLITGYHLNKPSLVNLAFETLSFIQKKLWNKKQLFTAYKNGEAYLKGYLDDYAYLLDALVTALQVKWDSKLLVFATTLADYLLTHFYDEKGGGFYFTAKDHETLFFRPKTFADEAIPSGNGIAVRALIQLGYLTTNPLYLEASEKTLQCAWPLLKDYPSSHCSLLLGLKAFLEPPKIIIIRGEGQDLLTWQKEVASLDNLVFAIPHDAKNLPASLEAKIGIQGETKAFICEGFSCRAGIDNLEDLKREVRG